MSKYIIITCSVHCSSLQYDLMTSLIQSSQTEVQKINRWTLLYYYRRIPEIDHSDRFLGYSSWNDDNKNDYLLVEVIRREINSC